METDTPQVPVTQEVQPEVKEVSQATSEPTPPPKPKKWLKLILITLIILIGLGGGGFFIWKNVFAPKAQVYKGVWMALLGVSLLPDDYLPEGMKFLLREPVFSDLDKAAESGVNTLAIGMGYWANEQGEVSIPPKLKKFLISFIDEAHARGFKIWLIVELAHPVDEGGNPRAMPEEWLENTDLIKNFELAIIETAKFAKEHDVEIFSPANEMYVNLDSDKIGRERSKRLIVDIKPKIDAVYSGKVCLKGEWALPEFLPYYSCFGPGVDIPKNEEEKNDLISHIEQEREKNIELIIGELWEGNDWQGSQEDAKRGFEMALEAVEGKVSGVFILDIERPLFPESFESTIKEFYTKQ